MFSSQERKTGLFQVENPDYSQTKPVKTWCLYRSTRLLLYINIYTKS